MPFLIRKLHAQQRLGDKLHALRRQMNFTLGEMSEKTKIQKNYLRALETNDFETLQDPIYSRPMLRTYARALGERAILSRSV